MLSAIANTLSKTGVVCGLVYFPELIAEIKSDLAQIVVVRMIKLSN